MFWLIGPDVGQADRAARGRRRCRRRRSRHRPRRAGRGACPVRGRARRARSPTTTPARDRRVASAALGRASSACTPTGPGISPAATIRSVAGSRADRRHRSRGRRRGCARRPARRHPRRRDRAHAAERPARQHPVGVRDLTARVARRCRPAPPGGPHQRPGHGRRSPRRRRTRAPRASSELARTDSWRLVRRRHDHIAGPRSNWDAPTLRRRSPSIAPPPRTFSASWPPSPQPTVPTILDYRRSMSTRSSPRAAWCCR